MAKRGKSKDFYINTIKRGGIQDPTIDGRVLEMTRPTFDRQGSVTVKGIQYPSGGWVLKSAYDEANPEVPKLSDAASAIVNGTSTEGTEGTEGTEPIEAAKLNRAQADEELKLYGIDPAQYKNVGEAREAVLGARKSLED